MRRAAALVLVLAASCTPRARIVRGAPGERAEQAPPGCTFLYSDWSEASARGDFPRPVYRCERRR